MSQLMIPDHAPDYLAALIAANPELVSANAAAVNNLSPGMHPMIGINGTRFFIKESGADPVVISHNGQPVPALGCVILSAKPELEKKLYLTPYTPGSNQEPDCKSSNGVTPDADSPNKQCDSCAGCWANAFGSGKDQQGNPSKGKACSDVKKLAIFAAGKVYGFNVPPGSLKGFGSYVRDLSARGIPLAAVITTIGFDLDTPQVLTFTFGGMVDPAQIPKVVELTKSKEVEEIITFKMNTTPALPAPAAQPQAQITQAPAQPAPTQPAAAPRSNRGGKKTDPAPAQNTQMDLGLGAAPTAPAADPMADLGLGGAPAAAPQAPAQAPAADPVATMSDADLQSLLGLPV